MIKVTLINEAKTKPGVDVAKLADALEKQANADAKPYWGLPAVCVHVAPRPTPGTWNLVLLDDADQADALGYHDLTPDGKPIGKVFVKTTLDDGQVVSVTASHELLEMLVDPFLQTAVQAPDGSFYAYEIADAVEDKSYRIDGIEVSDFVTPYWFRGFLKPGRAKFSFLGSVDRPFALTTGGYVSVFKGGKWTQVFGSMEAKKRFNPARKKRAVRRTGIA